MNRDNLWAYSFRMGFYDSLMPVNYDRSLQKSFEILNPAEGAHILDVGCGGGRLLRHAASWLRTGGHISGIDLEETGILYAMQRARQLGVSEHVTLQVCDMRRLAQLPLKPMDGAIAHFSVYVLSDEADRRSVVRQIGEMLRPGARLVISVPSEGYRTDALLQDITEIERTRTDVTPLQRMFRRGFINNVQRAFIRKAEESMNRGVFHRYSYDELHDHLRSGGFRDIQIEQIYGGCGYRAVATCAPAARAEA